MSCPWVAADLRFCVNRAADLDGLSGESRFVAHLVAHEGHATRAEAKRLAAIANRLRARTVETMGDPWASATMSHQPHLDIAPKVDKTNKTARSSPTGPPSPWGGSG